MEEEKGKSILRLNEQIEAARNENFQLKSHMEVQSKAAEEALEVDSFAKVLKSQQLRMENDMKSMQKKQDSLISDNANLLERNCMLEKEVERLKGDLLRCSAKIGNSEADLSNLIKSLERDVDDGEVKDIVEKELMSDFMSPNECKKRKDVVIKPITSKQKTKKLRSSNSSKYKNGYKSAHSGRAKDPLDSDVWSVFDD